MKTIGEIRDTVHKYVNFTELEKNIIDSSFFQRLRRIKQLAFAELTYPGADYSRFSHSLGTMHLARASLRSFYEVSALARGIRGFVGIVRVYTPAEHREEVVAISRKLFDEQPHSPKVSFW